MSLESEQTNIFKFDSNDILKFYSSPVISNKVPYSPTFSPNNKLVNEKEKKKKKFKLINLISSQNIQQNILNKTNKLTFIKFIISLLLLKIMISYFDFDDVIPYKIIHDLNYEKILGEIPNENTEVIKVKEYGEYRTFVSPKMVQKFNKYIDICKKNKLIKRVGALPQSKEPKISVIYLYTKARNIFLILYVLSKIKK